MVDAYEAVKMAMYLAEENLTGTVDVSTQVHLLNSSVNATTGLHELRGLAWGQAGSVAKVEFRINDGEWMEAAYETVEGGLAALERFEWVVALDLGQLAAGNQTVEVRGLNDQGAPSLSVFATVVGKGDGADGKVNLDVNLFTLSAFLVLLILVGLLVQGARIDPPATLHSLRGSEPVEAVLLDGSTSVEHEAKASPKPPKS
ncbi:MAG: hypothetical protein ACPHF0_06625, partial [Poseidonia sp.]